MAGRDMEGVNMHVHEWEIREHEVTTLGTANRRGRGMVEM